MTNSAEKVLQAWIDEARSLPQTTRQAFLDAVNAGRTLGEAQEIAGLSFGAALGIMQDNIVPRFGLRREAR